MVGLIVLQLGGVQQGGQITQHCHHLDRLALAGICRLTLNSQTPRARLLKQVELALG